MCFFSEKDDLLDIFQAICVDDGSPDNSIEILSNYAEKYGNIKVVQQKNRGLSSARNTGIKYASGEYLHFLDSDDTVKINTYEELYKKAKENNLDMLFFDAETIYETDEIAKKVKAVMMALRVGGISILIKSFQVRLEPVHVCTY